MKNLINTSHTLPLLFLVLVGAFVFNFTSQDVSTAPIFEMPTVEAFGGSGGDGGSGGSGGDSGCGGCGGSTGSTGSTESDGGGGYFQRGCTEPKATNYSPFAVVDDGSCTYPPQVVTFCKLTSSATTIENGASVTLSWETEGFETIKINDQTVSGKTGSKTFTNITLNTTYTLVATNSNGDQCQATVEVKCLPPVVVKECELDINKSVNKSTAQVGDDVTYTITVKNIGNGDCTGGGVKIFDVVDGNLVYKSHTLTNNLTAGYGNQPVYSSSDRTLRFNGDTLTPGETGTITWIGKVSSPNQCGDFVVKNQAKTTAKELNNFQTWVYSQTVKTNIDNDCDVPVSPQCPYTSADGVLVNFGNTRIYSDRGAVGSRSTAQATNLPAGKYAVRLVAWDGYEGRQIVSQPNEKYKVVLANGSGIVTQSNNSQDLADNIKTALFDGQVNSELTVAANVTSVYALHSVYPDNTSPNSLNPICAVFTPIVEKPLPTCDSFSASPTSFAFGGGDVTLKWETTNATNVSISGIGNVSADNTTGQVVSVPSTRTFVLTATNSQGEDNSCVQKVTVGEPEPVFTCGNNVTFSVSDSSITRGDSVNLKWSTVNVDSLTISNINTTALAGNQSVSPSSDTTYVLRATNGTKTIDCPVSVDVSSGGGGGGGTPTPRCDLDISDKKIKAGEEVTLTWETSNANEVTIKDDKGKVIFSTEDYLSSDKKKYYDSSIKVKPTRDTKYTLTAERGSRDRDCSVQVELDDTVVVLQDRDQLPLVAGISLTQVPYTGFEAGPFMTSLFYLLLVAWSLFITYLLVIRNRVAPVAIKTFSPSVSAANNKDSMKQAEAIRPDVFVPSVMSKIVASQTTPTNLPTGTTLAGHDVMQTQTVEVSATEQTAATALENRAHTQKALLSSDAVQHFLASTEDSSERDEVLDQVIAEAKKTYPLEDGWIVINQARMQGLCEVCAVVAPTAEVSAPTGAGSLAESIVTGNIVAAYQMIGHRPMLALAEAAADLDAVYRNRKGERNSVSHMLTSETQNLSDEQITEMIAALTGAIDGTYTDEASAVKMSIMKAVKVAA